MMILNAVFYIICMFIEIFSCNPIPANWDVLITDAKCINKFMLDVVTAIVNTISDLIIWILPLPTIWNLQMNRTKKISISVIFSAGLLCVPLLLHWPLFAEPNPISNNTSYRGE